MFRYWYLYFRFSGYFQNAEHGLKAFAEKCMNALIRKTTEKITGNREKNERLKVEKLDLDRQLKEISESPMLDNEEIFSVKKKIYTATIIWWGIFICEGFLNYVSTLIFLPGEEPILNAVRWAVAIVLTFAAMVVSEKLVEAALLRPYYKKRESAPRSTSVVLWWSVVFVAVEVAILGISQARAKDIEAGTGNAILYYGFLILSMALPPIAGLTEWDKNRYIDAYKNTRENKKILSRITQIDSLLQASVEYESLYYKAERTAYWDTFIEFKAHKEVYNRKQNFNEDISTHYARGHDAFEKEADKRYESDIRDRTAEGIVKLERTDTAVGTKVGQSGGS